MIKGRCFYNAGAAATAIRVMILAVAALGLISAQITSQSGAITGVVTDPTGAIIQNATITLDNFQIGQQKVTSGEAGEFTFPLLAPGFYKVTVESPGFAAYTYVGVPVEVTQVTNLRVMLKPGAVPVEITVTS